MLLNLNVADIMIAHLSGSRIAGLQYSTSHDNCTVTAFQTCWIVVGAYLTMPEEDAFSGHFSSTCHRELQDT